MSIEIDNNEIKDIFVNGERIVKVYNGNDLVYDKGTLIDVTDYEYTLDNQGNLILTKYIGSKTNVVTPNI
jgi:hypothetical protein